MTLRGRIIKYDGNFCFESTTFDSNKPQSITHLWPLVNHRVFGMCWKNENDAIGKEATCVDGTVSCYLGDGVRFGATMPQGGSTKAIHVHIADVPKPKRVRGETRWHYGAWQKYSKRQGWIAA